MPEVDELSLDELLGDIENGIGAFSTDHLTHASNVIQHSKACATRIRKILQTNGILPLETEDCKVCKERRKNAHVGPPSHETCRACGKRVAPHLTKERGRGMPVIANAQLTNNIDISIPAIKPLDLQFQRKVVAICSKCGLKYYQMPPDKKCDGSTNKGLCGGTLEEIPDYSKGATK